MAMRYRHWPCAGHADMHGHGVYSLAGVQAELAVQHKHFGCSHDSIHVWIRECCIHCAVRTVVHKVTGLAVGAPKMVREDVRLRGAAVPWRSAASCTSTQQALHIPAGFKLTGISRSASSGPPGHVRPPKSELSVQRFTDNTASRGGSLASAEEAPASGDRRGALRPRTASYACCGASAACCQLRMQRACAQRCTHPRAPR